MFPETLKIDFCGDGLSAHPTTKTMSALVKDILGATRVKLIRLTPSAGPYDCWQKESAMVFAVYLLWNADGNSYECTVTFENLFFRR